MKAKLRYPISSIDDIVNCITNENLDRFIKDFHNILRLYLACIEMAKDDKQFDKLKNSQIIKPEFTWIDDKEYNITIVTKKKK